MYGGNNFLQKSDFLDGYVIAHYSSNVKDFLYPTSLSSSLPGRDVTLYKTSLFNPIRITVSFSIHFNDRFFRNNHELHF